MGWADRNFICESCLHERVYEIQIGSSYLHERIHEKIHMVRSNSEMQRKRNRAEDLNDYMNTVTWI